MDASREVLAALERLEGRLARIETALGGLEQAPALVATATDSLDGAAARLAARGVDVDERLHVALELAERLTAPTTLAALEGLLALAQAAPGLAATAGDTLDGLVRKLAERGIDVDERLNILWHVAERLTAPEALDAVGKVLENVDSLRAVLDSGVFDESAVDVVGSVARALSETRAHGVEPAGALGLWRALSDPGVRRSLGVAIEFGRCFGAAIAERGAFRNGSSKG